jgi:hypothetical protein
MDKPDTPVKEVSNPLHADNTTTLDYAVAKLLKEPEAEAEPKSEKTKEQAKPKAPLKTEPDDTAEEEEDAEEEETPDSKSEDSDQEDEEQYEDDDGDSESEQSDEDEEELKYYTVKLDGEEMEVTLDELRSGYQRQKDYTKKTQALAEDKKATKAKTTELEKLHSQSMHQATLANELLNRDLKAFEKVDWEGLKEKDPIQYVQKQIELQDVRNQQVALQQQAAQAVQMQTKNAQEALSKAIQEENPSTLEAFPDWNNEEKRVTHQGQLADFAKKAGFTDEELSSVYLTRDLVMLDKARKYDEIQANRKTASKKKRPPIRRIAKAGVKKPKGTARKKAVQAKRDQFHKSGSLKDAAAFMYEMQQKNVITK